MPTDAQLLAVGVDDCGSIVDPRGFRLSGQQTRTWSLQTHGPAYRVQCAFLIEGPLDAELSR